MWFVTKTKNELTKNHHDIEGIVTGIMPENREDRLCPVRSFKQYMEQLHPENKYMWQVPLAKINPLKPDIWFSCQHQGKNTLGKFMSQLSLQCHLSKMYTNHSIRVTGITVLTRMKFSSSEIMSVSGHKSVQSLTNYQRTQPKQKISMGKVLYQSMTRPEEEMHRPSDLPSNNQREIVFQSERPQPALALQSPLANMTEENTLVPFEPNFDDDQAVPDFDLLEILAEFEKDNGQPE